MTERGYAELQEKLRKFQEKDLPRAEKRLGVAREMGDLSENAEYDAAREELRNLERQIAEVNDVLGRSDVVQAASQPQDETGLCSTVEIEDQESGQKITWEIVGYEEGDIDKGRISVYSPLGEALVGYKVGAVAEAKLPVGDKKFKILSIKWPS